MGRGRPRRFTPEQDAVIAERYLAGESTVQLARALETDVSTVRKSLMRTDTPRRAPGARPGALAPKWKGGRFVAPSGYVMAYCKDEFPTMANKNGHTGEHRLVMARHLGRPLETREVVHHLNGDKQDNRIENLELWAVGHPSGQRQAERCPTCGHAISWTEE